MFSLSRREFPDLLLTQDNLDDIANLWLDWHEQARARSLRRLRSYQTVRLRLWGFPRPTGEMLAHKLEEKATAARLAATVSLADPDYLTVTTVFHESSEPSSLGPWLSLVDDAAFDGLLLFLEWTLQDWPDLPEGPAAAGGTLVLCGQLREDGLLLKALWPVGLEPGPENLYKLAVWPEEHKFLRACESHRTGTVLTHDYFAARSTQRRSNWLARLFIHVPGPRSFREGRLSAFLWRATFHLFFLAVFVCLYYFFPAWPGKDILLLPLCIFLAALAHVVAIEVKRVCAFYRRMKTSLKRVYSQPLKIRAVDPADYGLDSDPNALKYTRELETLGCRYLEDFRFDMGTSGTTVHRIFVLPSERIYVFLNLLLVAGSFQRFPAHASFLIRTDLTEGRIITINEGGGYRRSLVPKVFSRRFPDIHDAATLVSKHKKFVAEVCGRGHAPAPLADLPELLERMRREHEEMSPLMKKQGYYSWAAAIRQSYELVRKEFLEPNPRGPAAPREEPGGRESIS